MSSTSKQSFSCGPQRTVGLVSQPELKARLTGSCDTTVGLLFVSQIFSKIARSPAALASLQAFSGTAANRRHDSLGKIPWVQKAETDAAPMSALSTRPHS